MKGRDSGMPDEDYWNSFFDPECAIQKLLGTDDGWGDAVEFGAGYGTFTFPAAKHVKGTVYALDIEPDLIQHLQIRAEQEGVTNIVAEIRDFVADGTGLETGSQSHAMIYNLLHIEDPVGLLLEAHRVLHPNGTLSVMHWRKDILTPRGPALDIRPSPEQCKAWILAAGFRETRVIDLHKCCPFHFGLRALP